MQANRSVDAAIRLPAPERPDEGGFLCAVKASRRLHRPWVYAPADRTSFRIWLDRARSEENPGFLVELAETRQLAGVVNLNELTRGALQSAYLGYYAFRPFERRGLMTAAVAEVARVAFSDLGLHRIEANIQPANAASIRLVEKLGFEREGFSRRYLKIGGRWRDHERWALLREEWKRG